MGYNCQYLTDIGPYQHLSTCSFTAHCMPTARRIDANDLISLSTSLYLRPKRSKRPKRPNGPKRPKGPIRPNGLGAISICYKFCLQKL